MSHAKENGIHGQPIEIKYNSREAAVFAAKLRAVSIGEWTKILSSSQRTVPVETDSIVATVDFAFSLWYCRRLPANLMWNRRGRPR